MAFFEDRAVFNEVVRFLRNLDISEMHTENEHAMWIFHMACFFVRVDVKDTEASDKKGREGKNEWRRGKRQVYFFARAAVMNRQSGWVSVRDAGNGIHLWRSAW